MPVRVVLGVVDGWDSVHILPAPGSLEAALCGREPSLPWRRVWIDHVDDLGRVTGCASCQAAFHARMVSARGPAVAGDDAGGSPASGTATATHTFMSDLR